VPSSRRPRSSTAQDIADPARLIGVGAGVLAAILRVPMLLAVVIGMGVCALIRTTGIL
jgi:uncharacterized membrane protein